MLQNPTPHDTFNLAGISLSAGLAILRCAVGFLGERDQFGWWQSSFFSTSAKSFLAPVFARTQVLAQCSGVTAAAARVHDDRIGVGQVYHLFRLPEDLEQSVTRALREPATVERIGAIAATRPGAMNYLLTAAGRSKDAAGGIGPTMVGTVADLRRTRRLDLIAAHYLHGFQSGGQVYPFLRVGTA